MSIHPALSPTRARLRAKPSTTKQCTDDCVLEPTCDRVVTYDVAGAPQCANTLVTVTSSDWVGCDNQNTAQKSFYVRYDDQPPVVTVTLGDFLTSTCAPGCGSVYHLFVVSKMQ